MTKAKIKLIDNVSLRDEIELLAAKLDQVDLAKWAISVAKHVLPYLEKEFPNNENIILGFHINVLWQHGKATVHEVRQAGFGVHKVARQCKSETAKSAARAAGQAVGVGHMREHAMVATDYAIKAVGLDCNGDFDNIIQERRWQLDELKKYLK